MEFGIAGANVGSVRHGRGGALAAQAAEAAGFDSVWTFEHVVAPGGYERYP